MAAGTTWNPSDKSANIGLTNGNLTATSTGAGAVRATNYISGTDKVFFSVAYDGNQSAIGVGDSTASLSTQPGSDTTHSIAYLPQSTNGDVYYNSALVTTIGQATAGDIIYCCIDFANNKIWFARNNGNYNNSGTANPATNTGGITISVTGNLYPLWYAAATGAVTTANFGATGFARAAPSGFTTVPDINITTVTTATTGSVTVASDASSASAKMEAWGGGGGTMSGSNQGGSGEGGGYAKTNAVSVSASTVIYYSVGAGGDYSFTGVQQNGVDSWIRSGTNSAPTSTTDGVLAKGGVGTSSHTAAGTVRTTTGQVGNVVYSGGAGANAQGGGGSRGGSSGGNSGALAANGNPGIIGSGSTPGASPAAQTGAGRGAAGGPPGAGGSGSAGTAGAPGGGGGGGGATSGGTGFSTAGATGQIILTLSTYYTPVLAARYWVGGSGNTNDTAHWSTSSGGASGASVPDSTFNVIFDANSDSGAGFTVTVNATFNCAGFDNSAVDQIMTLAGSSAANIYGSLVIKSNTVFSYTGTITFAAASNIQRITTNGVTLDCPATFNGASGIFILGDALTIGSTRLTTLTNGTLNLASYTLTTGTFSTAAGTKNIIFNAGTLTVTGSGATAFNNAAPTNFTTTAGTGTGYISLTSASAKTFVGGDSTYNCTLTQGGAGALTITGSNTLNDIRNTTQPVTVSFTAGTTTTFTNGFSLSGTAGNLVTIGSATAATHTLSKTSGTISVSYCTISRSTATGGATWNAFTSNGNVDGGNNTGWIFSSAYILTASNGTYALTGQSATLQRSRLITANNGTYALTGRSITITKNRVLTASNGTYALTGQTATIIKSRLIVASNGIYTLTGRTATLQRSRLITANSGSYSLNGQTAVISYLVPGKYEITALAGSYALTGQTITLQRNRLITANSGSYALNGQTANITTTSTPFVVIDTHDGDYLKKKFEKEKNKAKRKREEIVQAYERLVEGKPDIAEKIVAPYIKPPNKKRHEPIINYNQLLADIERAEQLWQAYIDMDDEEVLMLL